MTKAFCVLLLVMTVMAAFGACDSGSDSVAGYDAGSQAETPGTRVPPRCGMCGEGTTCCFSTGACYDPSVDSHLCPLPSLTGAGGGGGAGGHGGGGAQSGGAVPNPGRACTSNAHCREGEYCAAPPSPLYCVAAGFCEKKSSCPTCGSASFPCTPVCGCDGSTYGSDKEACEAGIRAASVGQCGTSAVVGGNPTDIGCANSSHCPTGYSCCGASGRCFESACKTCCGPAPEGTSAPCEDDKHGTPNSFCKKSGCGPGSGGCVAKGAPGNCNGELVEVCGCDGKTYANACWARVAGTNIRSASRCSGK